MKDTEEWSTEEMVNDFCKTLMDKHGELRKITSKCDDFFDADAIYDASDLLKTSALMILFLYNNSTFRDEED